MNCITTWTEGCSFQGKITTHVLFNQILPTLTAEGYFNILQLLYSTQALRQIKSFAEFGNFLYPDTADRTESR